IKPTLLTKLEHLNERYEELGHLLNTPEIINDSNKFRDYSKEYAQLENVSHAYRDYQQCVKNLTQAEQMLAHEADPELKNLAEEEMLALKMQREALEQALQHHLIPQDPNDNSNVFLEIRAAAGGDESAIFGGYLFRM